MKPLTLEFCGINSFSEPARIDFKNLTQYGIFGIFGDTGSGKSTILDAIGFALYGDVTRSKGSAASIINYRLDKAYSNFEFEIEYRGGRKTYRVEREIKRKNALQSARVYEKIGESETALAEGVRDCNALLLTIIGLEQKDFDKCIALPQGEFAQFVKAGRADRLKLIARLFDFERYGEVLVKRTNARVSSLREEVNLLKTRLEPYEGSSEENNRETQKEISALEEQEKGIRAEIEALRAEEKTLSVLLEKKRERDRLLKEKAALNERKAETAALNSELMRLEKAAFVLNAERERVRAFAQTEEGKSRLERAKTRLAEAEKALERLRTYDAQKADAEIEALTAAYTESKSATVFREEHKKALARIEQIQREFQAELELFRDFSYEAEREKIEKALEGLGGDDLFAFLEAHGKESLFRDEYAEFAGTLSALTEKHPDIAPDTAADIEKYTALGKGKRADVSSLSADFERAQKERERLRGELVTLEKYKSRYDLHLNRLQTLETERASLKTRAAELTARFEGKGDEKVFEEKLRALKEQKRLFEERQARFTREKAEAATEFAVATEKNEAANAAYKSAEERLIETLKAGEFESAEEAKRLTARFGDPVSAREKVEAYREKYAAVSSRLRELTDAGDESTVVRAQEAERILKEREGLARECAKALAVKRDEYARAVRDLAVKRETEKECEKKQKEFSCFEKLKKLIDGNQFMEYVAEEYLVRVSESASQKLLTLTSGRYFLKYDGGFFVGDNFDGGNLRGVGTLSGGETFLVSLSLAVSLSEEICARSLRPIEFFFLDEGFGTLDERLVDTVMDSLEKLKGEHFTIGIISHVEELKRRIDRKLIVQKATEESGSRISEK